MKFFKRIGTGAEIKAEIKSKLLSSIGRDLSKTLPRLLSVSTPEKKMRLLKAMGNIYKGMEENNVKLEKVGLKNLLKEIQIFEKTQKLEKGGEHHGVLAETHPIKSLKRSIQIFSSLNTQVWNDIRDLVQEYLHQNIQR